MAQDHFLSRWARRKREVRLGGEKPGAGPALGPGAEAESTAIAGTGNLDEAAPEAEVLAELPSLDSLTAETDLSEFLKAGVPQVVRNAALRRMWSLDPGIRDYLSEAREYAFDWHISGAVPGTGPMLPTDDIAGMVRDVFAGSKPAAEEPVIAELAEEPGAKPEDEANGEPDGPVATPAQTALPAPEGPMSAEPLPPRPAAAVDVPTGRLRRHGGALPI